MNNERNRSMKEPHPRAIKKLTNKEQKERWPKLTKQNKEFLRNYVELGNATESWARAYPKSTRFSASRSGSAFLAREDAKDYIQYLLQEYEHLIEMEVWEIMREVKKIAMNPDINSNTKLQALKMLGQGKGEFVEKSEVVNKDIIVGLIDD